MRPSRPPEARCEKKCSRSCALHHGESVIAPSPRTCPRCANAERRATRPGPASSRPRPRLGAPAELAQHFRTYFIALTANTYSTMHYDIIRPHKPQPLHELHTALQDACGGSPPAGVEQRDYLLLGCREVHRDAIGDGDREQQASG